MWYCFSMEFVRNFPSWIWWVIGIVVIAAIAAAAVLMARNPGPRLPPGLVEKRAEVVAILDEAARIEDVDLQPLVGLEAKKDFKSSVALMEQALVVNERQERLNASLLAASEELTQIAVGITPDTIGAKAVEAFSILKQLAQTERDFFTGRKFLYETTRNYYADLAAKKRPAVPANLKTLVDTVNAQFAKAKELHRRFTEAVAAFDEAIRKK